MFANAKAYERFMGRWSRLIAAPLLDFAGVPDDGQLLDIGSGTGSLSFEIIQRKKNARVTGIDSSKEFVAFANDRNPDPDRLKFETGDARQLPYADASFEGCLSLLVFNFIPDPRKALEEARRVTKPGGVIAAAVWDYGREMRMLRAFWDAAASIDESARTLDEAQMPLCRPGELTELWEKTGLSNVQEQSPVTEMKFRSFEDYWEPFLLGQGPAGAYVASLNPISLEHLRIELMRRVSVYQEDASITLRARAWAVRGIVQ